MSRSIEGKIKINSFADIVGAKKDAVAEIPLADLHEFRNHPFRVLILRKVRIGIVQGSRLEITQLL